jgi:hypothetical protein
VCVLGQERTPLHKFRSIYNIGVCTTENLIIVVNCLSKNTLSDRQYLRTFARKTQVTKQAIVIV